MTINGASLLKNKSIKKDIKVIDLIFDFLMYKKWFYENKASNFPVERIFQIKRKR